MPGIGFKAKLQHALNALGYYSAVPGIGFKAKHARAQFEEEVYSAVPGIGFKAKREGSVRPHLGEIVQP